MNEQSRPVQLQDHSPVDSPRAAELCRAMDEKISQGQCELVDLLETLPGRPPRDPQKDVRLVEWRDRRPWTRNYVGLFQMGGERVVITSRFDQPNKPHFLFYLLETCWDAAMLLQEGLHSGYRQDFFDVLLMTKLAVQLRRAGKKGRLRLYCTFQHNDSRVRGPIDVSRHIRENLGLDNGNTAYRTRAYSQDNDYNVLLLQAMAAAEKRYPALMRRLYRHMPGFSSDLGALRQAAPGWADVQRGTVLRSTAKKIANPIYRDYEPARTAARAILRRMGADPTERGGRHSSVTGVFLDIDELWEWFLAKTLFDSPKNAAQQTAAILDGRMNIRPDFWWREKGVVLDAKNREAWGWTVGRDRWNEYVRDDVYQVLTYMLALDCRQGGVVFPCRSGGREARWSHAEVSKLCGRSFWRIPVNIPRAEEYGGFVRQMKKEMERLRQVEVIQTVLA